MSTKKTATYLKTDLNYRVTAYNLAMLPNVTHLKNRSSKGRFAFAIDDDPIFTDVLIQVCSGGSVNIYFPRDAPEEKIVHEILNVLSKANQAPIRVLRANKDATRQMSTKTCSNQNEYRLALSHSRKLLFTHNEIEQLFDMMDPGCAIDVLAFQVRTHRHLLSHLKTGYLDEIWVPLEEYRNLMKEKNYPESRGKPRDVIVDFSPLGPINAWDDQKRKDVKVTSEDLKEIRELKTRLIIAFYEIMDAVSNGTPLSGSCDRCPNKRCGIR